MKTPRWWRGVVLNGFIKAGRLDFVNGGTAFGGDARVGEEGKKNKKG